MSAMVAAAKLTHPRVLSVQSHVVHGYVGNKCAVFPLQLLGLEVDAINSVQFCCHTGYKSCAGQVLQGAELDALVDGLEANGLVGDYSHLLTGYIGSDTFLCAVLRLVALLKEKNPHVAYFCDPVLGDNGKLYVPASLVEIYQRDVIPLATVLTPNQFECELLTDTKIACELDAVAACDMLHARGVPVVVITSLDYGGPDEIVMMLSEETANGSEQYTLAVARLGAHFTGTGDLTAALLLAWMREHPLELPLALEKTAASVAAVLQVTLARGAAHMELEVVASKRHLERPLVTAFSRCRRLRGGVVCGVVVDGDVLLDDAPTRAFLAWLRHRVRLVIATTDAAEWDDFDCVPRDARTVPHVAKLWGVEATRLLVVSSSVDPIMPHGGITVAVFAPGAVPAAHTARFAISNIDALVRLVDHADAPEITI